MIWCGSLAGSLRYSAVFDESARRVVSQECGNRRTEERRRRYWRYCWTSCANLSIVIYVAPPFMSSCCHLGRSFAGGVVVAALLEPPSPKTTVGVDSRRRMSSAMLRE